MTLAEQFVEFYYKTFDTDRASLAGLYVSFSSLPFLGEYKRREREETDADRCLHSATNLCSLSRPLRSKESRVSLKS